MSSPQPLSRSPRTAPRSLARRIAAALLAVVAVTAVLGSAQTAGAQDVGSQRAKVAKLAKELDRLRMQSASLNEDFLTAEEELTALQKKLADNQAEVTAARTKLDKARSQAGTYVVAAYVGAGSDAKATYGAGNPNESVNQKVMLDVLRGDRTQMADDLSARESDLADSRKSLDAANDRVAAKKASVAQLKSKVSASVAAQERLLAGANEQLRGAIDAEQARLAAAAEAAAARQAAVARQVVVAPTTKRVVRNGRTVVVTVPRAAAPAPRAAAPVAPVAAAPLPAAAPSGGVAAVLAAGRSVFGTPYRWGGTSPATGFDCSGFTSFVWRAGGKSLPRTSRAQYSATQRISAAQLQPGDLVFYGSPIHHVSVYIGGGQVMHSPRTGKTAGVGPLRNPSGYGRVA